MEKAQSKVSMLRHRNSFQLLSVFVILHSIFTARITVEGIYRFQTLNDDKVEVGTMENKTKRLVTSNSKMSKIQRLRPLGSET